MIRIVKLFLRVDATAEFEDIFAQHRSKLIELSGCHSISLLRDHEHQHQYMTVSVWPDLIALEEYRQSDLFAGVWAKVKPLLADKTQVQNLQVLLSDLF